MWICLYKMWLLYKSNVGIAARKAFVFRTVNSDTRNSETGAEEYTILASNAFGLPHRFPVCQSSGSLSGRIPETLRKIYNMEKQET